MLGVLAACGPYAGKGTGVFRVPSGETGALKSKGEVRLSWSSASDISHGEIHVDLPDGRQFTGTFVQPQRGQWRDTYNTYYGAWTGQWGRASPWYSGSRSSFAIQYADTVLAHLESADGTRMRCGFALYAPDVGIAGGGQGDCQLSTNEDVFDAVLDRVR